MQKAMEKIENAINELRKETGNQINFICSLQIDVDGKHVANTRIDVNNDHYMMDILCSISETWRKGNHPNGITPIVDSEKFTWEKACKMLDDCGDLLEIPDEELGEKEKKCKESFLGTCSNMA